MSSLRCRSTGRRPWGYAEATLQAHGDSELAWPVAPNLIAQDFAADGPDRQWGGDISYIWTAEGRRQA